MSWNSENSRPRHSAYIALINSLLTARRSRRTRSFAPTPYPNAPRIHSTHFPPTPPLRQRSKLQNTPLTLPKAVSPSALTSFNSSTLHLQLQHTKYSLKVHRLPSQLKLAIVLVPWHWFFRSRCRNALSSSLNQLKSSFFL